MKQHASQRIRKHQRKNKRRYVVNVRRKAWDELRRYARDRGMTLGVAIEDLLKFRRRTMWHEVTQTPTVAEVTT